MIYIIFFQIVEATSPIPNGLRRTPPKENGDHSKKEPTSPRSGRSSASSTPVPPKKANSESGGSIDGSSDKSKPATNGSGTSTTLPQLLGPPSKQGPLGAIPFNVPPGFPGAFPPPGGLENGYRPQFDSHPALRPPPVAVFVGTLVGPLAHGADIVASRFNDLDPLLRSIDCGIRARLTQTIQRIVHVVQLDRRRR